jgi:hypothetical protein
MKQWGGGERKGKGKMKERVEIVLILRGMEGRVKRKSKSEGTGCSYWKIRGRGHFFIRIFVVQLFGNQIISNYCHHYVCVILILERYSRYFDHVTHKEVTIICIASQ